MKELQQVLHILSVTTRPSVLATLVKVEGSSYRRVGARLLWQEDGTRVGSISGGCLEEDLLERARNVLENRQPQTVVYDTTEENDVVWGVGLGCHGIVRVLLEPLSGLPEWWRDAQCAWARRRAVAAATAYESEGDLTLGACAVLTGDGVRSGSPLPPQVEAAMSAALFEGRSQHAEAQGAKWFVEYIPPPISLTVFGAGDDAQPLARLADGLGWSVSIADPRSAFATRSRFPQAAEVRVSDPDSLEGFAFDSWSVVVVMTHHYRFDLPLLRQLLPLELPYLGLLGPKKRGERILRELEAEGLVITQPQRERLHSPVGLDLGAGTPDEVAHSIVAEILATLNSRDARPLKDRTRPIHG